MTKTEAIAYVEAHQIYVQDADLEWDGAYSNDPWSDDGLGVADGLVGIQVPRAAGFVPVFLEILNDPPQADDSEFCKIAEAGISISTGTIALLGEDNEDAFPVMKIPVQSGAYVVRVLYSDLDSCTYDDDDGADHYVIQLFPGSRAEAHVAKTYNNVDDPVVEYRGSKSTEELESMAASEDPSVRCGALVALARSGLLDRVQAAALTDRSIGVRLVAVGALHLVQAWAMLENVVRNSNDAFIKAQAQRFLAKQS